LPVASSEPCVALRLKHSKEYEETQSLTLD
jgi:hypothetical protein